MEVIMVKMQGHDEFGDFEDGPFNLCSSEEWEELKRTSGKVPSLRRLMVSGRCPDSRKLDVELSALGAGNPVIDELRELLCGGFLHEQVVVVKTEQKESA